MIALTGVPGTGKTTAAQRLADDWTVVPANELTERVDAVDGYDEERDATIVDEEKLQKRARDALPEGPVVVEGALSHHCDPDLVLVLRCHPQTLRERLRTRDWPKAKVEENVMAETLDAIPQEVENVEAWEIDTTDLEPERVADLVDELLQDEPPRALFDPLGSADWTSTLEGAAP